MGEVLKICGGALLCVIASIVLRSMGRELHLPLQWTGIVALTGAAVVLLQPILAWLSEVAAANGISDTVSLLLRALGIAAVVQLCADLCRQSGESAIASSVELVGRVQLLLLALPVLQKLLSGVTALLSDV